ncbi:MAG TPA: thioesterase family protein [Chloroflexi bacterium]|jgi:fluoroacetyl-CoA thioesterase|nr:thioesterase family protein [Chloroflexota bacterium]
MAELFDAIQVGATGERSLVVEEGHTAHHWGSGVLYVLATPEMIALMEGAAVDVVDPLLPEGYRSVGTVVNISHLAPTVMGRTVTARAELIEIDGRRLTFRVVARDEVGVIGEGEHQRFIIHVERFTARAESRGE